MPKPPSIGDPHAFQAMHRRSYTPPPPQPTCFLQNLTLFEESNPLPSMLPLEFQMASLSFYSIM